MQLDGSVGVASRWRKPAVGIGIACPIAAGFFAIAKLTIASTWRSDSIELTLFKELLAEFRK